MARTFTGLALLCVVLLGHSAALGLSLNQPGVTSSTALLSGKPFRLDGATSVTPELSLCPMCVQFMSQAINGLLQIILQGGVLGSCGALCGQLPNKVEATVCNLLCDYVGITEFLKLVQDADPDPIWICEELHTCPDCEGAATITQLAVNPPTGPQGTSFNIAMDFTVQNKTCTGEIAISINPPAPAFPFGSAQLVEGFKPGAYGVKFDLKAQPSQQEPFNPGKYGVVTAICAGSCGSKHAHAKVLSEKQASFEITA